MKKVLLSILAGILILTGLAFLLSARFEQPAPNVSRETQIAEQVQVLFEQATQTAMAPMTMETSTPEPVPTIAVQSTPTQESSFLTDCDSPDPRIAATMYELFGYGNLACKLVSYSPDGQYIAYVTLVYEQGEYLKVEAMGKTFSQWRPESECSKCTFRSVQWGPGNTLVAQITAISSGPRYVAILDVDGNLLATMTGAVGTWNSNSSALYVLEDFMLWPAFSVYDFSTDKLYELDMEYGTVSSAGWSGDKVYFTVQPYTYQEGLESPYCSLPSYAAVVELTPAGPQFSILRESKDGTSNFFVDQNGEISKKPFKKDCTVVYH